STPTHTKKASRSATPKWRPSTSKATPSIPNGITPSSHDVTKPQVEAFVLRRRLSVARSMALVVSDGQVVYSFGGSEGALFASGGKFSGVPVVLYATILAAALLQLALTMTRWGRYVFAVGGNARAARLTGLSVKPIKV